MKPHRSPSAAALALAMIATLPAARAQVYVQPTPYGQQPVSSADELASEMRLLAANPTDVRAMIRAGELTLKLDDPTAAATFFTRAERIDPNNPRIKAGRGTIMVQAGRPGEALRRFAEAEQLHGDPRSFAADRGLAYDLLGEQERAQRDYRLALKTGADDETTRRYALSLGISGQRDAALAQLDALLRRSDRAAWRARAFILAMNGDARGAERIAGSMMPGGLGQGLQPFFDRLPTLKGADRAFAVHFGEVRTTPQRMADARLAPPLAALSPDPDRPVALASVTAQPIAVASRKDRRKRGKRDTIEVALAAAPVPLPAPPVYQPPVVAMIQPLPPRATPPSYVQPAQLPVALAANRATLPSAVPVERREGSPPYRVAAETNVRVMPMASERSLAPMARSPAAVAPKVPVADTTDDEASGPYEAITTAPAAVITPAPTPVMPTPASSVTPSPIPVTAQAAAPRPLPPTPGPMKGEDTILAKIIANITVPGSELDVGTAAAPEPDKVVDAAPVKAVPVRAEPDPAGVLAEQRAAEKKAADKKLADKKLADKKAADAKKLADAKKAEELKRKNDPKILEPSRIWVQVAGGANAGDLPKEWAKVKDKAPAAFKGKGGWMTPLRATNRVLAGPFKTDAEARSFVNALSREGLSAFTFTSEAGQKVTKLGAK